MLQVRYHSERLGLYFTDDFRDVWATRIFFKSLVTYALLKMLLVWPLSRTVMTYHSMSLPGSIAGKLLMAPSFLANKHIDVFFGIGILFLLVALVVRRSYLINLLFFWLTFNLYTVDLPVADGSDFVLFMLAMWCIPITDWPRSKREEGVVVQKAVYNIGRLCCQLQVVFIYLVSGLDKLGSGAWRSGDAFVYIRHLEARYNPVLPEFLNGVALNLTFSWGTIAFELLFAALVWVKSTRRYMLAIGILFHLSIWIVLSLPDFALIMILSYLIFLKDTDYEHIMRWFKRLLP